MNSQTILAIETSCDDTSIALVKCSGPAESPRFEIIESVISSQIAVHRPFGGVVPNLAKREHIKNLPILWEQIAKSHSPSDINQIAVTVGPGLEPALWTGITFAQELATKLQKPLIGINHLEGHLYSNLLTANQNPSTISQMPDVIFPAIALLVSGGHTIILNMKSWSSWEKLGETLDDAAGEAFDKVAKMLGLLYPGGPEIEQLAAKGNTEAIKFPRPLLNLKRDNPNYNNFSFSGLKTSVLYYIKNLKTEKLSSKTKADIAASFQQAILETLIKKTIRAAQEYDAKSIMISGGVSSSKTLREAFKIEADRSRLQFFAPENKFNTDNAAMIAAAAYINLLNKKNKTLEIKADSSLTI